MNSDSLSLKNKVVLVTGSTEGIGKAVADQLKLQEAVVITNSRHEVHNTMNIDPHNHHVVFDVTDQAKVQEAVKKIYSQYGKIDILVNNVGTSSKLPIIRSKEESMDYLYEVNLKSIFLVTKEVLKYMLMKHSGHIINIGSIAGFDGLAMQAYYSAFKSAQYGYIRSIIKEYGMKGIRANMVAPGAMESNSIYSEQEEKEIINKIPVKRLGNVADIANVVGFLCSDMASYINGQVIRVDGGVRF